MTNDVSQAEPKARSVTQMEDMWTKYILPIGESRFAKSPLKALIGADYSHLDARYACTLDTADERTLRHFRWMQNVYGCNPGADGKPVLDAKALLGDQRDFPDSRQSLGIQVADMLATILRRAFNDRLGYAGWKKFGTLLVRRNPDESRFLELGASRGSEPTLLDGHAKKVWVELDDRAKSMMVERPERGMTTDG